jgi:hypothetical protein
MHFFAMQDRRGITLRVVQHISTGDHFVEVPVHDLGAIETEHPFKSRVAQLGAMGRIEHHDRDRAVLDQQLQIGSIRIGIAAI